jgi:hypothetical protein
MASGTAALLIACFPREPCACAAPLAALIVRGSVAQNGSPLSNAFVQAEGFMSASCASTRMVFLDDDHVARTNADGTFTLRLLTTLSPAVRCMRFIVRPTSLGGADSVVIAGVQGTFKARTPPDTMTLNFAIP